MAILVRPLSRFFSMPYVQAIRIVEHEEFFSHTAEERLIYRQACHDHHILESEAAYQGASLDAKEALLKRCAHFSLDMEACDATAAVRLLGARKRARIQSLQKQLEMEACRAVHLKSWDVSKAGLLEGVHHPEAKLFLQKIHGATSAFWAQKHDFKASLELLLDLYDKDGQPRLRPEVRFHQPLREADIYQRLAQRHLVQHTVAKVANHPRAQQILAETQVCSQVRHGIPVEDVQKRGAKRGNTIGHMTRIKSARQSVQRKAYMSYIVLAHEVFLCKYKFACTKTAVTCHAEKEHPFLSTLFLF